MDWITHEEDVWFEFRGNHPDQLEPGRYYQGTVDGFAEFGVFIDLSQNVTGLLHKSEIDRRLESLDWDAGDTVFVQVKDVRDNGNVDLGWSIRQSGDEFRGSRVHDPNADQEVHKRESNESGGGEERSESSESEGRSESDESGESDDSDPGGREAESSSTSDSSGSDDTRRSSEGDTGAEIPDDLERTTIETLDDRVGDVVSLEGKIVDVRQTSGPTVFELRDETGTVECAAFEAAGVRAYPGVDVDDVIGLVGEVERHHGELQVETESVEQLTDDDHETVEERLQQAIEDEARAPEEPLLADHPAIDEIAETVRDAATEIRAAVFAGRPVVVRHSATVDGYTAGVAIERAVLPLVRQEHPGHDAEYHFFERRPLEDRIYDMDSATSDVTDMLEAQDRHGEQIPLVVLADAGATRESAAGYGLLDAYGADRLVLAGGPTDPEIEEEVEELVATDPDDGVSSAALAANLAVHVHPEVREEIRHLPAVSYWSDVPAEYDDLADEAGYGEDRIRQIRQGVALSAYYQSYEDKREIMADLLVGEAEEFAGHLSEQFEQRLEEELDAAAENLGTREADGITFAVLDTDAFTHRFDFPPTELLIDELHRRHRDDYDRLVTLGLDDDELRIRATSGFDVRAVAETARDRVDNAGITAVGGRDGHLEFLVGERDSVLEAAVAALADELA